MAQLLRARERAQLTNQLVVASVKPERNHMCARETDQVDLYTLLQDANTEAGTQGEY